MINKIMMLLSIVVITGCASAASVNDLTKRHVILELQTQQNFGKIEKVFNPLMVNVNSLSKRISVMEGLELEGKKEHEKNKMSQKDKLVKLIVWEIALALVIVFIFLYRLI